MNGLEVIVNENQEQTISGRMLHEFLEVKTAYKDWFPRMKEYGFIENTDFILVAQKRATNNPKNPWTEIIDHIMKLDMAKELCMLARSDRGKQARQYFIQVEKDWNSPEKVMSRALVIAKAHLGKLQVLVADQEQTIAILEPKAKVYDKVMNRESTCTISDIAVLHNMAPSKLFKLLREAKWLYKPPVGKHQVAEGAPEGAFRLVKDMYGEQIRVTTKGREQFKILIQAQ